MDSITKEELETVVDRLLNSPKPKLTFFEWDRGKEGGDISINIISNPVKPSQTFFDVETMKWLPLNSKFILTSITADD